MSRVWVVLVLVLVSVGVPSVGQAQGFEPICIDPSGGPWYPGGRCVQPFVRPPTSVPAWLQPAPPRPAPVVPVVPPPIYVPPAPAGRGLDPWIPLAGRPAPAPSSADLLTQMLLLERLAAARAQRQAAPAPPVYRPAPPPPAAPGDGWMSGFIKGVK